jgi:hypothetical protein
MAFARKLFFAALFLSILMEATTTNKDPWSGGFAWYFHADLKSWIPATGIPANPFELAMIVIFIAWGLRGRRDKRFHFERGLLYWPILAVTGMLTFGVLWGLTRSGSDLTIALDEVRALFLCVAAYFLVGLLFIHRRDLETLTWIILISACLLGIECSIRYFFFLPGHVVGDLDYDHEDAILLAFAILLSGAMILLGSTKRQKLFAFVSIVVDLISMMLTHRRAGEAALATGAVFLALILFRVNRRLFMQIVPLTALAFGIYLAAYWNCTSGTLCQPARAISSQFNPDPRDKASNDYRITEREDLSLNIQSSPFTGLGFGQPFLFFIPVANLSFWKFWNYTPHNEILWVWVKAGMFGFFAFWWLMGSGLYRSGRLVQALSLAGDYRARALLAAAACLIIMQMTVSYVDLGLTDDRAMLLLGVMFGVIGHLRGILRRSTDTDRPDGRYPGSASNTLDAQEPEVQVGILARVLVTPVEEWQDAGEADRPSPRRPATRVRSSAPTTPPARPASQSRWGQAEEATTTGTSGASWRMNGQRNGQYNGQYNGQRASAPPSDASDEALPWSRRP